MGKIEIKVHLIPGEAETRLELDKNLPFSPITLVYTDAEGVGSMLSSFTSGLSKNFIDKKKINETS